MEDWIKRILFAYFCVHAILKKFQVPSSSCSPVLKQNKRSNRQKGT